MIPCICELYVIDMRGFVTIDYLTLSQGQSKTDNCALRLKPQVEDFKDDRYVVDIAY